MTVQKTVVDLIAALRSGKYEKGQGVLRRRANDSTTFSYCCEGVMCEISEVPVVDEQDSNMSRPKGSFYTRFSAYPEINRDETGYVSTVDAFAPSFVWEGSGMTTMDGQVACIELPIYDIDAYAFRSGEEALHFCEWNEVTLASMNDYESISRDEETSRKNTFTFAQIADLIEWALVRDYGNK